MMMQKMQQYMQEDYNIHIELNQIIIKKKLI